MNIQQALKALNRFKSIPIPPAFHTMQEADPMTKIIQYIIKANEPFDGEYVNIVVIDSNGNKSIPESHLSLDDYLLAHPDCILISCRKYKELLDDFLFETAEVGAHEISAEHFYRTLDKEPPYSWYRGDEVEYFYIYEGFTLNLVSYFCRIHQRYFEFIDFCTKTNEEVLERIDLIKANHYMN